MEVVLVTKPIRVDVDDDTTLDVEFYICRFAVELEVVNANKLEELLVASYDVTLGKVCTADVVATLEVTYQVVLVIVTVVLSYVDVKN